MISPLTKPEFIKLKELINNSCGIHLEDDKDYLVETRLSDFGTSLGAKTFTELHDMIVAKPKELMPKVIDLMTTNETYWFRDDNFWKTIEEVVIPNCFEDLVSGTKTKIRFWSAASSTGQEAYSLSMLINEYANRMKYTTHLNAFEILGTDISLEAIELAQKGVYNIFSINRGLNENRKKDNFTADGTKFQINNNIKSNVTFKSFNLMDNFLPLGQFDYIFCRNVSIYFAEETKITLFKKIFDALKPNGFLFLGACESLTHYSQDYKLKEHKSYMFYEAAK